jgi:hypothetical protein
VTRTRTFFEEVLDPSSDLGQLVQQVEEMRKALGLQDPKRDPNEIQEIQKKLDLIKLKLASVATLTANVGPDAEALSVSSTVALTVGQKYRIDQEIIVVTSVPPDMPGTIVVRRHQESTAAARHLAGALILPEPLPK